ncbi:MAG: multiheme c-type cytochrome [Armatimonadota bacterium]
MSRVRTATFLRWHTALLLTGVLLATAVLLGGCGGGTTNLLPSTGFIQTGANYVGTLTCQECHGNTWAQYTGNAPYTEEETNHHGFDFAGPDGVHGEQVYGKSCAPCHTTGYNETAIGGFDPAITTVDSQPGVDGIGCENCHGPGSKHAAAFGDVTQITKNVQAQYTCWNCHVGSTYKEIANGTVPTVNDTYLLAKKADGAGPHHPQTSALLGMYGANIEQMPSPHATLSNTCLDCHFRADTLAPNGKTDHRNANLAEPDIDRTRAECAACHAGRHETMLQLGVEEGLYALGGRDDETGHPNGDAGILKVSTGVYDPYGIDPKTGELALLPQYVEDHRTAFSTNGGETIDLGQTTYGWGAGSENAFYVAMFKRARNNYILAEGDKSLGVHNPEFVTKLIEDAKEYLAAVYVAP